MLSNPAIHPILSRHFIAVRLDWEQGNHYRDRFGFVLGTGDQLFLTPEGDLIPPEGENTVYGRHGQDTDPDLLNKLVERYPASAQTATLDLDWFFWPRQTSSKRRGGWYPPPVESIAQYTRLPIAIVDGPLVPPLEDSRFLARHVRQFIWKRGDASAVPAIRIRRVRDGLPESLSTTLADLEGDLLTDEAKLGAALDMTWMTYMKDRPLTARGYVENEHGGWMRGVAKQMVEEDEHVRAKARAGRLIPPGRAES